ncbi:MAG: MCE family protein [Saprospiraceae bacterium]|nr:MCE family protein [Saprospiraceae bacterium]
MSRELKIGILTFIVLVAMIWGYTFLKGTNLLSKSTTVHTTYPDVSDLNVASPVLVNGFRVGTVTKIVLNKENVRLMDVYYEIEGDYKIPVTAVAVLKNMGLVGGRGIFLEFDKICSGPDCLKDGGELKGKTLGMIGSMLGENEMGAYTSELSMSLRSVIGSIGAEGEPGAFNEIFRQLEAISKNLNSITATTNSLMSQSSQNINATIQNLSSITESIARNNKKIENFLSSLDKMSGDLANANLGSTVNKTNATLDETKIALQELKTTLSTSNNTMKELGEVMQKIENGEGTMGLLVNDKKLYENLNATSKNMALLLQDLRLNPKRYVNVSVFGKKQKEYTLPENDPALKVNMQ